MCEVFTQGPKSQVPIHLRSIRAISIVESMEVETHHCTRGPKYERPSMTWMPTWQMFFGGEAHDLC
jgi:hypothetical protein